jgi:16S rRNA (uracil1498-N3)-methyltransferase
LKGKALEHQRFYFPPEAQRGDLIEFPPGECAHMISSLRLRKGDRVSATDGAGKIYDAVLERATARVAVGRILRVREVARPSPSISLFQGVTRSASMEVALEKCVELGIDGFVPVLVERSIRRPGARRLERLRRIAVEAMKQSLGAYLAHVHELASLAAALEMLVDFDLVLVASERERQCTLSGVARLKTATRIAVWIGPEGGLADDETGRLLDQGAIPFSLGSRRLKSETAAIAAVAVLRSLCSPDSRPR